MALFLWPGAKDVVCGKDIQFINDGVALLINLIEELAVGFIRLVFGHKLTMNCANLIDTIGDWVVRSAADTQR